MHFCDVCGSPRTPSPTSTQKERIIGCGTASPGPVGVMSPGSMALSEATQRSMPPPAFTTATSTTTEAKTMTMPCMASVSTTARKPPTAVYRMTVKPKSASPTV